MFLILINIFEFGLNYRKYFREFTFQPFAQLGIGHGQIDYPSYDFIADGDDDYIYVNIGFRVCYRYKRWSFETGLEILLNDTNIRNVSIKPMVGASFSF